MKISACWITKNEEANIELSINSVKKVADELIVVDTGSTDNTVAIAKSLGARVEHFEWIHDFSAARNYALSLVSGGIVIFIDADEWFEPVLGAAERDEIEKSFQQNPRAWLMSLMRISVFKDGSETPDCTVPRIFLNKDELRYVGKIHEALKFPPQTENIYPEKMPIKHSGYHEDIYPAKIERNIAILQSELDEAGLAGDESIRIQVYLVREYLAKKEYEKAFEHLVNVLKYPSALKNACHHYSEDFLSLLYVLIEASSLGRSKISRRDVYQKLFMLIKKAYPSNPGAAEADLLYQALFDLKEDRLFKELGPAVAAAGAMHSPVAHYKKCEAMLYEAAAVAAWRRGDYHKVMEYCVSALKNGGNKRPKTVAMLLCTVKGQPVKDIILFINSIFNTQSAEDLELLISGTCIDGFADIHTYYLKKRIDSDSARIADYLRVMLIHQKYDELVKVVSEAYKDGNTGMARYLFFAAVCGVPYIELNAGMLGEYRHILDAFYEGRPLEAVSEYDVQLLWDTYNTVACTAGLEAAERYLGVFANVPRQCYKVKAVYLEDSGMFDRIISEDMTNIDPLDFDCRRYFIGALIAANCYDQALSEIERLIKGEVIEQDLMNMLLVVSEKASKDIGARARSLYEQYIELHDAVIDLADIVNTGILFDNEGKKQNKILGSMTRAQFDKQLKAELERPVTLVYLDLCGKAADVYLDKGVQSEAVHCLTRLVAHGCNKKESCEKLAEIFKKLGNNALSSYVKAMA